MRTIKEIRAEMSKLREEYDVRIALLEQEVAMVRDARGYVPKAPVFEDYYEQGRSVDVAHG